MWKVGCGLTVFVVGVVLLLLALVIVPAGSVGIITRWGAVQRVVYPGLSLKVPIMDGVVFMDTRVQKNQVDAEAASKDLQLVTSTIALNYHIIPERAVDLYQNIGTDYDGKILDPAVQNTFKAVTARFPAEDLIQERETVKDNAKELLSEQLAKYYLVVDDFNITNFDFSPEYNAAIEAKQVAQQEVETSKQKLERTKIEAQQQVAQAQGQADAQKALKDTGALSPEYLQYIAIQKWDGKMPYVLGSGSSPLIDLNTLLPQATTP